VGEIAEFLVRRAERTGSGLRKKVIMYFAESIASLYYAESSLG
jgi:hypothetical protein